MAEGAQRFLRRLWRITVWPSTYPVVAALDVAALTSDQKPCAASCTRPSPR